MKKLLVCTDGSNYAGVCCEYAAWLAKRSGAAIDLLYVTDIRQFEIPLVADLSGSLGIQPYQDITTQLREMENQKALLIEESHRKIFEAQGLADAVSFHHRTGLLVDSLDDFEDETDIILLGKRGENADYAKGHLGSNLERVIRASSKPCLVTSRAFRQINKLVLAYDGGESCRKALAYLINGSVFRDLTLHIVTVAEDHDEDAALDRLNEAEKVAQAQGFAPVCQMLGGDVENAISDYVESEKFDLLVMGAYGHSRIRNLIIGSTTTEMIRDCHIPVLCFR